MSTSIYRGDLAPKQQRYVERYSPAAGWVREVEWRNFGDVSAMQRLAYQYAAAGCEYELDVAFDGARLHATDNTGNVTIDTWEIGTSEELIVSTKNPKNIALIPVAYLELINRAIKDGSTIDEAKTALESETGDTYPVDFEDQTEAVRLYKRMQELGQDSFFYQHYILRHTTNVSNRWDENVADSNVNHIYTPAQLLTEVEDATAWVFPLPGRLSYKIINIPEPSLGVSPPTNYLWGWVKSASPESTCANNRVNIVTEYKLAHWCTDEYDPV